MEITEIVLLIAGGIIFILSFFIPEKKGEVSEQSKDLAKEEIADMVNREMESIRGQVDGVLEEAVTYAMEKTERSLERLSNEKIMAVNEYSDTVLSEIHKNHEEAMFLYDMLNNKHTNLKSMVAEINRAVKDAEEQINNMQGLGAAAETRDAAYQTQQRREGGATPAAFGMAAELPEAPKTAPTALERLAAAKNGDIAGTQPAGKPQGQRTVPTRASGETGARVRAKGETEAGRALSRNTALQTPDMAAQTPAAGRVSFLQETDADGRNNNERILELYNRGKSMVAIAKELGLGVGEVKLVIDLFKNQ